MNSIAGILLVLRNNKAEILMCVNISILITEGIFRMGSTASRIQPGVTASLIIDAGTLNGRRIQVQDNGQFIAAGSTMSYTWTRLSSDVLAGATTATTSVATGWSAGSEIVISPTIRHASTSTTVQYDRRTLTSVSGTTLGFSSLTNPHSGTGEFAADVINLTRNCRIQSLSPTLRTYMTVNSALCNISLNEVEFINFGSTVGAVNFIGSGATTYLSGLVGAPGGDGSQSRGPGAGGAGGGYISAVPATPDMAGTGAPGIRGDTGTGGAGLVKNTPVPRNIGGTYYGYGAGSGGRDTTPQAQLVGAPGAVYVWKFYRP